MSQASGSRRSRTAWIASSTPIERLTTPGMLKTGTRLWRGRSGEASMTPHVGAAPAGARPRGAAAGQNRDRRTKRRRSGADPLLEAKDLRPRGSRDAARTSWRRGNPCPIPPCTSQRRPGDVEGAGRNRAPTLSCLTVPHPAAACNVNRRLTLTKGYASLAVARGIGCAPDRIEMPAGCSARESRVFRTGTDRPPSRTVPGHHEASDEPHAAQLLGPDPRPALRARSGPRSSPERSATSWPTA